MQSRRTSHVKSKNNARISLGRFPHLLAEGKGQSLRDRAAHKRPPSPAQLIVFFFGGRVGIELQDIDAGQIPRHEDLDLARMTRHEPRLAPVLDDQLNVLVEFCADLLTLAVPSCTYCASNATDSPRPACLAAIDGARGLNPAPPRRGRRGRAYVAAFTTATGRK